jgi:hypothetical protein
MAKKAAAKDRAGSPLPAAGSQTDDGAHGATRPATMSKSCSPRFSAKIILFTKAA